MKPRVRVIQRNGTYIQVRVYVSKNNRIWFGALTNNLEKFTEEMEEAAKTGAIWKMMKDAQDHTGKDKEFVQFMKDTGQEIKS